jgi:hypothetical protein
MKKYEWAAPTCEHTAGPQSSHAKGQRRVEDTTISRLTVPSGGWKRPLRGLSVHVDDDLTSGPTCTCPGREST